MLVKRNNRCIIRFMPISMYVLLLLFVFLMRGASSRVDLIARVGFTYLWFAVAAIEDKMVMMKMLSTKLSICTITYIFIKLLINMCISNNISEPINSAITSFSFYVGIFAVQYYYFKYKNGKNIWKMNSLIAWMTLIFIYYCLKSIKFYIDNPGAGRVFKEVQDLAAVGNGYGIAFGAAVAASYFAGIYMVIRKEKSQKKISLGLLFLTILGITVCFYIQSSIVIYSAIIGVIFNIVFARKNVDVTKSVITFIFLSVILGIIVSHKEEIIYSVLTWVNNMERNAVIDRVNVIGNYILYGTKSVAITGRQAVYIQSIENFLRNPIFGASTHTTYHEMRLIGDHSTFLDDFGRFGILLGILNVYVFLKPFKQHYFSRSKHAYGAVITLILIAIFDPITQSTATAIIFMYVCMIESVIMIKKAIVESRGI